MVPPGFSRWRGKPATDRDARRTWIVSGNLLSVQQHCRSKSAENVGGIEGDSPRWGAPDNWPRPPVIDRHGHAASGLSSSARTSGPSLHRQSARPRPLRKPKVAAYKIEALTIDWLRSATRAMIANLRASRTGSGSRRRLLELGCRRKSEDRPRRGFFTKSRNDVCDDTA